MKIDGDGDTYTAILMALADAPDYVDHFEITRKDHGYNLIVFSFREEKHKLIRIQAGSPSDAVADTIGRFLEEMRPVMVTIGGVEMPIRGVFATDLSALGPMYIKPPASAYIRLADDPPASASAVRRCPACGGTNVFTQACSVADSEDAWSLSSTCGCGWRGHSRDLVPRTEDAP
jgi:hypothetical protein